MTITCSLEYETDMRLFCTFLFGKLGEDPFIPLYLHDAIIGRYIAETTIIMPCRVSWEDKLVGRETASMDRDAVPIQC